MALPLTLDQIEAAHKAGFLNEDQYKKAIADLGIDIKMNYSPISSSLQALNATQGKALLPTPAAKIEAPSRALQTSGDNVDLSQMKSAPPPPPVDHSKARAVFNGFNNSLMGMPNELINSYQYSGENDPKKIKAIQEAEKVNDERTERASKEHPYISGASHLASDVALAAVTGGLGELGEGADTVKAANYLGTGLSRSEYINHKAMQSIKNSLVRNEIAPKETIDKLSKNELLKLHRNLVEEQLANPHAEELRLANEHMAQMGQRKAWQGGPDFENADTELSPDEVKTAVPKRHGTVMANALIPDINADNTTAAPNTPSSLMNISPQQQSAAMSHLPAAPILNQQGNSSIVPNARHFTLPEITMSSPPPASPVSNAAQALAATQGKALLPNTPLPPAPVAPPIPPTDSNVDLSQMSGSNSGSSTPQISHPGDLDQSIEGVNSPAVSDGDGSGSEANQLDMSSLDGGSGGPKGPSPEKQLMDDLTANQTLRGEATGKEQESLQAQADARAKMEQQKAAAQNSWNDEARARMAEIDQDRAISHQSMTQQMADIQSKIDQQSAAKIDPQQWWKDRGAGRSVLAAISMALGAAGSSMSGMNGHKGTPNFAGEIIQKAIEQNIDAQKDNIADKWRSIAASSNVADKKYVMEQGMIADKTKMLAEGQMLVKNQIEGIVASGQSNIDPARAQELIAQIDQHLSDTQDTYAKHMYDVRNVLRSQQNSGANPALLYQKYVDEGHKSKLEAAKAGQDPNKVEIVDFPTWYKTRYGGTGMGSWNQMKASEPDENGISPELIDKNIPKPLQDQAKEELKKLNEWQSAINEVNAVGKDIKSVSIFSNPANLISRNIPGTESRMSWQDAKSWNAMVQTTMHKLNAGSGRSPEQELAFNAPFLIHPETVQSDIKMKIDAFHKQIMTPPNTPTLRRFGVFKPPAPKVNVDAASLGAKPLE